MASRVFISFDYDNDEDLKNALVGQARLPDSPFEIADWSIKTASPTWQQEARQRIRRVDQVAVMCGTKTHLATGVAVETTIAQQEGKPYFLLWGRRDLTCTRPTSARPSDKVYEWTWDNLKRLIKGDR